MKEKRSVEGKEEKKNLAEDAVLFGNCYARLASLVLLAGRLVHCQWSLAGCVKINHMSKNQLDLLPETVARSKFLPTGRGQGSALANILTLVVSFLTIIAGFWFAIQFILAGWEMLTAGSDSNKMSQAQKKIINSLIGLFIVIGALLMIKIIAAVTGINILNVTSLIKTLTK